MNRYKLVLVVGLAIGGAGLARPDFADPSAAAREEKPPAPPAREAGSATIEG